MTELASRPALAGSWQLSTVVGARAETRTARTLRLRLSQPAPFVPGQHFIVRLTAPDGYQASRSYSVASAPEDPGEIEITVERLPGGEVSTFLHDELRAGDKLEVRGPIGGWFVWSGSQPAVLLGGGSGVVPLMSMLRFARTTPGAAPVQLIVSVRDPTGLYYSDELPGPETVVLYSRSAPAGSRRAAGRITGRDLPPIPDDATVYVCGSSSFADAVTALVMEAGVAAERIRIERFGPTG